MRSDYGSETLLYTSEIRCHFHQRSFYKQLVNAQIPKVQKTVMLSVFFALFGSAHAKTACKKMMKLTPDGFNTWVTGRKGKKIYRYKSGFVTAASYKKCNTIVFPSYVCIVLSNKHMILILKCLSLSYFVKSYEWSVQMTSIQLRNSFNDAKRKAWFLQTSGINISCNTE